MKNKILLLLSFIFLISICYEASTIFITFGFSLAVAYLLQPSADKIAKKFGIRFSCSALIVYSVFMIIISSLLVIIIPRLINELEELFVKIPEFQASIHNNLIPFLEYRINQIGGENFTNYIVNILRSYSAELTNYTANFLWHSILSTINLITMFFLFPVLLFFFLKDFEDITRNFQYFIKYIGIDDLHFALEECDKLLRGFVSALLNVASILAIYYSVALSLIGIEFSLILGIFSGFAVVIPFVGAVIAFSSCLMISLLINGVCAQQLWILLVFAIGQIADGSYLTPKIVGDKIGLHPTVIIFSVFVGAHILGPIGLFISIPIAGVSKIFVKRFILQDFNL